MLEHQDLIKIVIAWACAGAFVFTLLITCASLVGLVKLADKKQQNKLFAALILEIAIVGVGTFSDLLRFTPGKNDISLPVNFVSFNLFQNDVGHHCNDGFLHLRETFSTNLPSTERVFLARLNLFPPQFYEVIYQDNDGNIAANGCFPPNQIHRQRVMFVSETGKVSRPLEYSLDSTADTEIGSNAPYLSLR